MKKNNEILVVERMIKLYCRKNHKQGKNLCEECSELVEYVKIRLLKCVHKGNKPFCSNCKIQCYKPDMKAKIRKVMKFSGPRIIIYHPVMAITHLIKQIADKRRVNKKSK